MSEILEHWRAGEGLPGVLVIDGHTHVGEWPHSQNFDSVAEMVAEVRAILDANGVDAACVLSGGYMWNGSDYRLGNDLILDLWRRLPARIIPFCHINPNDDADSVLAELTRMQEAGCRCIKLLNSYQKYPGDGPNLMLLYRFAAIHNMLVINHWWTFDELERIATEFPEINFICAHYSHQQDPLLIKFPNVYANIWTLAPLGFLERGIRAAGAHKFLFGSDAFMNPMSVGIGPVVYADISDDEKRQILGLTQARLLARVGALPESLARTYGL